ncbi:molybdopterin-dependent oxidoreductase [Methanocella conradii]|uniref:molybdopterin-dependent oxidoreductase n=1 Tax=Methanocella conradii TaxID=1175444 RepID=UPI00157D4F22|nr:molybdopterin-dependent oxidoreductase [Methanocella conradii]
MMKRAGIMLALIVISAAALGCTSQKGLTFEVKGQVERPGTYDLNDYKDKMVTINARLDGEVTHLPARDYTGVPLRAVLKDAGVKGGATQITISASDGYMQAFELSNVTASDDVILINDNDTVRVVAKGYPGGKWVEMVTSIEVT